MEIQDLFKKIYQDVKKDQQRIKEASPSINSVHAELHGTVLQYILEMATAVNHAIHQESLARYEAVLSLNERISEIENISETQFDPDDAALFMQLVEACTFLCDVVMETRKGDAKLKSKLDEVRDVAAQCKQIIEDCTMEEDDDDSKDSDQA